MKKLEVKTIFLCIASTLSFIYTLSLCIRSTLPISHMYQSFPIFLWTNISLIIAGYTVGHLVYLTQLYLEEEELRHSVL